MRIRHVTGFLESQRLEMHARRIKIFFCAFLGVHPVEAAHYESVHHVYHGFRYGVFHAPGLIGRDAFLKYYLVDDLASLGRGHAGSLFSIEAEYILGRPGNHDAHAIGAGIRLDNDVRGRIDPVFIVFSLDVGQQALGLVCQALATFLIHEVDFTAVAKHRVQKPGVDIDQL